MKSETVPIERFRELVKTNEKHYQEVCTLKAKLAEVEECLRWASKHCNEIFPCADRSWLIDNVHQAPTLYEALRKAWEEREK